MPKFEADVRRQLWRRFAFRNSFLTAHLLLALLSLTGSTIPACRSAESLTADQEWQSILEQAGGPGTHFQNQAEAMTAARQHLDRQQSTLRDFLARFPADGRHYSAQIRLSSVLQAQAKMLGKPALKEAAEKLLASLQDDPATPDPVKADVGFAQISQKMQQMAGRAEGSSRDALMRQIRQFDTSFPRERRTPGLLTEIATLYDSEPDEKKRLLTEAQSQTTDEALRLRIADDLKRLNLLGKPLELRFQPWQGGSAFDLSSRRGHVVVLLFWASWSGPALHELASLMEASRQFAGKPVDFLTVSLDEDKAALAAIIKASDLRLPVHCDGRGWKSERVQSFGINALPTVFVLDRKGNLLALNARGNTEEEIERALAP